MKPATLFKKFRTCRALVVGDICLDRWCHYDPAESDPSRETQIPRLGVVKTRVTPGAGGTVANNLAALRTGQVAVLGAIGQDGSGFELERALGERNIDYRMLVASPHLQTFTYTKLINSRTGKEDRPRVDFINNQPLPGDVEDQLIVNFHSVYQRFDIIIVSDQAETDQGGVISDAFREVIADVAERHPEKVVLADSRNRIGRFRNTLSKANRQEADAACKKLFGEIDYARLRETIGAEPLIITRGGRGSWIVSDSGRKVIPAVKSQRVVDSCGAGDSFAAGLALALRVTGDLEASARFGSLVSSLTIGKEGTGTASPSEVIRRAKSLENGSALGGAARPRS